MKNIFLALLLANIVGNSAFAQKISADKVPSVVTTALKSKFPGAAKINWEMEKSDYEANFKLNGEEISASFDNMGKWLETETEIKISALPSSVQQAVNKYFDGFKVKEASKIESLKNGSCFEAEIERGDESFDVLFTAEGKMLNKIKSEKEKEND